ncbi:MAG: MBL fold metallo-hydrolase [Verrucomicrobiota bacterium]
MPATPCVSRTSLIPASVLAAGVLAVFSIAGLQAGPQDGRFDLYWIDSQGGGSTLLVSPGGESVLIDTGNPGGRDSGRILKVAREVAGLTQLDHLIITHLHSDHFGGAPEIAAAIPVRHLYDNGVPDRDPDGNADASWPLRSRGYREMPVGERQVAKPGDRIPLRSAAGPNAPTASLVFVAAHQKLALHLSDTNTVSACRDVAPKAPDASDNANSIVTLLQFGRFRYFNGGDLTWNVEGALVCPVPQVGSVDVYQVNHHGLDISNNPLLLRQLAPSIAVFNNGPRKGCMPEVVTHLRELPSLQAIYQVWRNQSDAAANAPAAYCANDTGEGGNYLKLSVAPDGASYTVTVPSTGHERTFLTRL